MEKENAKIFLVYLGINSPQNTGFNYGLSYIGSVLKGSDFEVEYVSLLNEQDCNRFCNLLKDEEPLMIGFSVTSSQFVYLKSIVSRVKTFCRSFIVCGGPHPTLQPECISDIPGVNAFVIGEGEYPMLELAIALKNKSDYHNILNLWINEDGQVIKNSVRPLIEDIDSLPFPDIDAIKAGVHQIRQDVPVQMRFIFSRGCPFDCSYCCNKAISDVYPNPNKYFRQRSPLSAIKEIEAAEARFKFRFIVFDDDCFTLNKKWFFEFMELYKKRFKYPFRCNIRVGTINEEMVKILKEAGASNIGVGIEHGNEKFRINVLKKNITNKQIEDTFSLIRKYELSHADFIMVGLPFETESLFLDTVRLCRKVDAKGSISIFYPYPGTELGELCKEKGWLPVKENYREREEATINYPEFSKEAIQLATEAFPFFLENKKIPLKTPLALVPSAYYLYLSLGNIFRYYISKLQLLMSFQFLKSKV